MRNFNIVCQGEVCKFDKPQSLSIKALKNMTPPPEKMENGFFQI